MMGRALLVILAVSRALAQIPEVPGTASEMASLRFIDVKEGSGAPAAAGKRFSVHYTGWLKDGTKFDSSFDRNEPFEFVQGRRQVIAGWDLGFQGMKVGGRRRLFIPYQLAYGEQGTGPIPGKADLIFDIELLDVKDVPAVLPAIDLLVSLTELEAKVTALAYAIPDSKYDPVFARIFAHIANLNQSVLAGAMKDEPEVAALNADRAFNNKEDVLAELKESFAAVRKELESARNGALGADAVFLGKADTRRGLFTALNAMVAEQFGEALAHARANGISGHGLFTTE